MVLGGELFWNCTNFSPTGLTFYQGGGGGGNWAIPATVLCCCNYSEYSIIVQYFQCNGHHE